jgi:pimeloyl-ACP methyl ester carboxylesterase
VTEEIPLHADNGVFGVLTRPDAPSDKPAIVLLSAGFIHRPGPFRLHVDLARRLAREGFPVARVDLPGVGDAPAPKDPDDVHVVRGALDAIGRVLGVSRFVVGGLCSAADLGWKACLADPRVEGLILLDGVARTGLWYRVGRARMLFGRGRSVLAPILARLSGRYRRPMLVPDTRDWPERGHERAELERMLSRGVGVFALYTGGSPDYFTHRGQFRSTFGQSAATHPRMHFHFWPDVDHMFMQKRDRERLIEEMLGWCNATFA